ncbi:hypothetical protein HMPREF2811_00170 [Globicatella sp. HMSC072A10]|uniref:hypothetical protein n=1 Tax=Globicatella sp. HMSC072A10 TaxID=1739315 RepID=UPI0008D3CAB6|nr:hypothetical protein [Globicatella sp. HMSC072A10]OFK60822.1 hypothetical protein HMPREF2811_00170 [Globicatella sp. HMSC072A10]
MKNNKALALPIVIVFMFLSHLTYISLLNYNQIQLMRYRDIARYYQGQSMLTISNTLLEEKEGIQQLIQRLNEVIEHQTTYLLPRHGIVMDEANFHSQLTMIQVEEQDLPQIHIISHQIYIEEQAMQKIENDGGLDELLVEGVVLSNKLPQSFDDAPIQNQVQDLLHSLSELGWEQQSNKRRNFQGQLNIQPAPYTQFDFNIGQVKVKNNADGRQVTVYDKAGHQLYQQQQLNEKVGYLILSEVIILEEVITP